MSHCWRLMRIRSVRLSSWWCSPRSSHCCSTPSSRGRTWRTVAWTWLPRRRPQRLLMGSSSDSRTAALLLSRWIPSGGIGLSWADSPHPAPPEVEERNSSAFGVPSSDQSRRSSIEADKRIAGRWARSNRSSAHTARRCTSGHHARRAGPAPVSRGMPHRCCGQHPPASRRPSTSRRSC